MSILGACAVPHPPIIVPEVGGGEEAKIAATTAAYREAMRRLQALQPETVVITSPHSILYSDYFHISPGAGATGNLGQFRAPQVQFEIAYDEEFVKALAKQCQAADLPAGTLGERNPRLDHATMVPLYFFGDTSRVKFVRIGLSGLSPLEHYKLGECVQQAAALLGRRTVVIASGDLSHKLKNDGPYGFAAEGPDFDRLCMETLAAADFVRLLAFDNELCEKAAECGLRSFQIMAGALDRRTVTAERLSYEGPFGVGYGVVSFAVGSRDESRNCGEQYAARLRAALNEVKAHEDEFVRLARYSLETYIKTGTAARLPGDVTLEMLDSRAGVFVSLKKNGQLRGCIGTFMPTQASVAHEILHNAVSAGTQDPRFAPVTGDELPDLVYSVDVLTEPEPATPKELDARKYGVIVATNDGRRGLLLPDLAGVDTVDEQLAIARRKGSIRPDEPVSLFRFTVVRHK